MKILRQQRGFGIMQWAFILAIASFFLLFAFKIVPLYAENRYVETALRSLEDGGIRLTEMSNAEINKKLSNFYTINNVRSDGATNNIVIERENNKVLVKVDYETRTHFLWNIDLVLVFKNHLDSTRINECCKPTPSTIK